MYRWSTSSFFFCYCEIKCWNKSKIKKKLSKWKKIWKKNCIWRWGGSLRLLKVTVFFKSINCHINHPRIAYPQETNEWRVRSFCDMLPLASAAGLRAGVFLKGNGWNPELAIPSLMQPAWMSKVKLCTDKISLVLITFAKPLLNCLTHCFKCFQVIYQNFTCRAITLKTPLEMLYCTLLF